MLPTIMTVSGKQSPRLITIRLHIKENVMLYIKIENPVCNPISSQFWTIWGSTTKREVKNEDQRIIGQFGSGGNHSIALCLRHGINPIIYNENEKLEFFTQPIELESITGTQIQHQVGVQHSGKDNKGKSIKKREILNHTLSFGAIDWNDVSFAMREFISNAIDACYLQNLDHKSVNIEIVSDSQIRAKAGTVRVFLPLTPETQNFYNNIGSWFLHFSQSELLGTNIFPRRNKNILEGNKCAMIYRRGVLVCEVKSDVESIFDYNVDDIRMNESRSVDSWTAISEASYNVRINANEKSIAQIIRSFVGSTKYWEHDFPSYSMSTYIPEDKKTSWQNVWKSLLGENAVVANAITAPMCLNKGYKPVSIPESFVNFIKNVGIFTDTDILTTNEIDGKVVTEPSPDFMEGTKFVWDRLESLGLTNNRPMPTIKGFDMNQTDNTITFGYWEKDTVAYNNMMDKGLNEMLLHTIIEELTHHVTKANDGSRDFQNYLIKVIAQTLFKDFGK